MSTFNDIPDRLDELNEKMDIILEILSKIDLSKPKKRLTIKEASEITGYAVNTIYGKVSKNEIPFKKLGAKVWFDRDELEKWASDE